MSRAQLRRRCEMSDDRSVRVETDSFGPIEVPADRYWGAQTQRACRTSGSAPSPCRRR